MSWTDRAHDVRTQVETVREWIETDDIATTGNRFYFLYCFDVHYPYLPPFQLDDDLDRSHELAEKVPDIAASVNTGTLRTDLALDDVGLTEAELQELKHSPLALVTSQTSVFAVVIGDDEKARKTVGNVKEGEAHDAPVVAITDGQTDVDRYADHVLEIPETHERAAAVLTNAHLQLLSYHTAAKLWRNIDKPRNVVKSVTVEWVSSRGR